MFGNNVPKSQRFGSSLGDMEALKEAIEGQWGVYWKGTLEPKYQCPLSDEVDRCLHLTHPALLIARQLPQSDSAEGNRAVLYWHYSPDTKLAAFHLHDPTMTVEDSPFLAYDSFTGLGPEHGAQVIAREVSKKLNSFQM